MSSIGLWTLAACVVAAVVIGILARQWEGLRARRRAGASILWNGHDYITHGSECDRHGCSICDGGLAMCKNCGCAEGTLPTECPGFKVGRKAQNLIYLGVVDFYGGQWRPGRTRPVSVRVMRKAGVTMQHAADALVQMSKGFARLQDGFMGFHGASGRGRVGRVTQMRIPSWHHPSEDVQ